MMEIFRMKMIIKGYVVIKLFLSKAFHVTTGGYMKCMGMFGNGAVIGFNIQTTLLRNDKMAPKTYFVFSEVERGPATVGVYDLPTVVGSGATKREVTLVFVLLSVIQSIRRTAASRAKVRGERQACWGIKSNIDFLEFLHLIQLCSIV